MNKFILLLLLLVLFYGCTFNFVGHDEFYNITSGEEKLDNGEVVTTPESIRLKAYFAAEYYLAVTMEYELGGDDELEVPTYVVNTRGIDCSGLIINLYKYAVEGTTYSLPFTDATADNIYKYYSVNVATPEKGDLIIWVDNNHHAFHIALLEKIEGGSYYFIESNQIDYLGINGVAKRTLSVNYVDPDYTIYTKRLVLSDNS